MSYWIIAPCHFGIIDDVGSRVYGTDVWNCSGSALGLTAHGVPRWPRLIVVNLPFFLPQIRKSYLMLQCVQGKPPLVVATRCVLCIVCYGPCASRFGNTACATRLVLHGVCNTLCPIRRVLPPSLCLRVTELLTPFHECFCSVFVKCVVSYYHIKRSTLIWDSLV